MPISLLSWSPNAATGATEAGKCPPAMENPPKVRVEILKSLRSCATSRERGSETNKRSETVASPRTREAQEKSSVNRRPQN
jgi:hypothetical protein